MGFGFGSVVRKKRKGDRFWGVERRVKKKKDDDCRSSDSIARRKITRTVRKKREEILEKGFVYFSPEMRIERRGASMRLI